MHIFVMSKIIYSASQDRPDCMGFMRLSLNILFGKPDAYFDAG